MKHGKEWFVESVKKNIRTYNNEDFIGIEKLNELFDKLDRLDVPVIPQFVADYIEKG